MSSNDKGIDTATLKVGDRISIRICDSVVDRSYQAVVVFIDLSGNTGYGYTHLLALNEEHAGTGSSHSRVWSLPQATEVALKYGFTKNDPISWWIDSTTTVLELLSSDTQTSSTQEKPCQICCRNNFLTDKSCWWCGLPPFPKA